MKKGAPISALFVDIGGVLLTDGWDHQARKRAAKRFNLNWVEMEERHALNFETHEEDKTTFKEYLHRVRRINDCAFGFPDSRTRRTK